jgi:hypothetical protein
MVESDEIKPSFDFESKSSPFSVPAGYFESFSSRLQEKIAESDKSTVSVGGKRVLRPQFAYLAGFVLLMLIGFAVFLLLLTPDKSNTSNESSLAAWVQYSIENIDEATLIESMSKNEPEPVNSSEITHEELIRYIQNEEIDLSNINEEL